MVNDENDDEVEAALTAAAKESHAAIDDAVRAHLKDVGVSGITTGWVLITSVTDFTEEAELDGLYMTASDGLNKWAKIGLMTVALGQETDEEYF